MMVGDESYEQAIIDTHGNLCTRLLDLDLRKIPALGSITLTFLRDEMENAEEVLEDEVEQRWKHDRNIRHAEKTDFRPMALITIAPTASHTELGAQRTM